MKIKKIIALSLGAVFCATLPLSTVNAKKSTANSKPTRIEHNVKKSTNSGFEEAKVVKVVDGDTIEVSLRGKNYKIRMVGVDTPETVHPKKPVQFYGKEASNYTKSQLTNKTVFLQKDVTDNDKYGRLLRYVWLSKPSSNNPSKQEVISKMYNAQLVKNGYAHVYTYPPDVRYIPVFRELEENARKNNIGLWNEDLAKKFVPNSVSVPKNHKKNIKPSSKNIPKNTTKVVKINKPSPNNATKNTNSSSKVAINNISNLKIKGNRESKIYHLPGGASYNRISEKNTVYFNSEKEAKAAGYRKALR